MEVFQLNSLINAALKSTNASIKALKASNKTLLAKIDEQSVEIDKLKETAALVLRNAVITVDPIKGIIKIDTENGSIETKVIKSGTVPIPLPIDQNCTKAAEQYLKDNLDLGANGVTVLTARSHYDNFGKKEGRTWKSELCK